jgi:hypothetical protein
VPGSTIRAPLALRGRDGVVDHRQHQLVPAAIAGRVHRMDDDRRPLRGGDHRRPVHGVAGDPAPTLAPAGLGGVAGQGADGPAVTGQGVGDLAAHAARGAEDQGDGRIRGGHDRLLVSVRDLKVLAALLEKNCPE